MTQKLLCYDNKQILNVIWILINSYSIVIVDVAPNCSDQAFVRHVDCLSSVIPTLA